MIVEGEGIGFWTRVRLPPSPLKSKWSNTVPISKIAVFKSAFGILLDTKEYDIEHKDPIDDLFTFRGIQDWIKKEYVGYIDEKAKNYGENAITSGKYLVNVDFAYKYFKSPDHYECMINPDYSMVGVSNVYYSPDTDKTSQLDIYL